MTDCPCDPCNRPRHPNLAICSHHSWLLEQALAELPALIRELDLTITRQTSAGARSGSRSTTRALPLDLAASEALAVLRSTLHGWVTELGYQPRENLDRIARWLYTHHGDLVVHATAEQAVDEITAATRNAWHATDRPDRNRITLPDPCPDCGSELRAAMHELDDPRPNHVTCTGTEPHRYEPHQWLRLGHRLGYGREAG